MDDAVGAFPISNSASLCVGGISNAEAQRARDAGHEVDGTGYYLFLANHSEPEQPIEILAKFWSASAAERLAKMIAAN